MAVKSFIRGDFRTLIVDNDYPTNYKVYYNGKWNYIQDEESFINKLNPDLGESYLNRFNLKVLDNNQWVSLAILENYYNKNEKRNSIFYRTITRENFIFKPRAVNFTEVDARLGLNNLQVPFAGNEIKYNKEEIEEITDRIQKDEILYKLGNITRYNELYTVNYNLSNQENFTNNEYVEFFDENSKIKHYYNLMGVEKLNVNNSNNFTLTNDLILTDDCLTINPLSTSKKLASVYIDNWTNTGEAGGNGYYCHATLNFYDLNGKLIPRGNVISNSSLSAETDNFFVETNNIYSSDYLPLYAISNNLYNYYYSSASGRSDSYLRITFKNPTYIQKMEINIKTETNSNNNCVLTFNYEDGTTEIMNIKQLKQNIPITKDNLQSLYNINDVQNFSTSSYNFSNFNIDNFEKFNITTKYIDDINATFKIAIKFDNNDYYVFKNNSWTSITSDKQDIFDNGMTLDELKLITRNDIINQFGNVNVCNFSISIKQINEFYNPFQIINLTKIFRTKNPHNIFIADEIYFDNFNSWRDNGDCGGRYLFYDENGDLIQSGATITSSATYAETENFIINAYSVWSDGYFPINAFTTYNRENPYGTGFAFESFPDKVNNSAQFLQLKFKTPQKISKIICNPASSSTYTSNVDMHIKLCGEDLKMFNMKPLKNEHLFYFENFNDIKFYDNTNSIITTNLNQIQNINNIKKIEIDADQPDNTLIRFAISLDNKNTYLVYQSNSWVTVNESDIIINGNTFDELNTLQPIDFNDLNFTNKTLDIIVVMKTLDENITPFIKSIKVSSLIEE